MSSIKRKGNKKRKEEGAEETKNSANKFLTPAKRER